MNRQATAVFVLLAILAGSPIAAEETKAPRSFKNYCETNTWYFSKIVALPSTLAGFERNEDSNKMQAFFKTPQGSELAYSEYEMVSVKAIEIKGDFMQVGGTDELYRVENDYTLRNTNNVLIMGAFDHRLLQIDVRNYTHGKSQALADAMKLARMVVEAWEKRK